MSVMRNLVDVIRLIVVGSIVFGAAVLGVRYDAIDVDVLD